MPDRASRTIPAAMLIAASAVIATAAAQRPVFQARSDVVVIDVAVSDGRRPVTTLTKDDFEIRDNGVLQSILDFDRGTLPLDVTLTIDISGSMDARKRAAVDRAIAQVSAALVPADRMSVVLFGGRVVERVALRHPPVVADLTAIGEGTSIYDALLLSLVTAPAQDRRQLAILMTDGDDTTSIFDERTVLETARHAAGQLSFVVVRGRGAKPDGAVVNAFRTIARDTGGELVQIDDDNRLSEAFLTALANFRLSYVLRYAPAHVAEAGWHEVAVRVTSERHSVRARRGYWR